jgi:hypothetical protein
MRAVVPASDRAQNLDRKTKDELFWRVFNITISRISIHPRRRGNVEKKWGKTIKDEETRCTLVKSGR